MPVQQADIVDPFRQGLRRLGRDIRNNFQLVQCDNLAVYPDGLTPYDEIVDPFGGAEAVTWPFPQLHKGKDGTVRMLEATALSHVTTSTNPWTTAAQTTYDFATPASTKAITGSDIWHVVDMGRSMMFLNGTVTIIYFPDYNVKYLVDDTVGMNTGCYHRGRAVFGAVSGFYTSEWQTYLTGLSEEYLDESHTITTYDNQIWFCTPGGGDLLWPFSLALAKQGRFDDGFHNDTDTANIHNNFPMWMEYQKQNGSGFLTMEWSGAVLAVKPLGKFCMIYGENGVSAIYPGNNTYGMETLLDVGIAGRGAVGGDDQAHVFLDEDGYLWTIDQNLKPERLDYHEFLGGHLGNTPVISFDPVDREYFIAINAACYLLTRTGLSKIRQSPVSIIHEPTTGLSATAPYGTVRANGLGYNGVVKTDIFDFGQRGNKTLKAVDLGAKIGAGGATGILSYRTDMDSVMNTSSTVTADDTGRLTFNVSGLEFQLTINLVSSDGATLVDFELDHARIIYEIGGKLGIAQLISGL